MDRPREAHHRRPRRPPPGSLKLIQHRLLLEWCLIALLALAVTCGLAMAGATSRLDNALYDGLARFRAAPASDRILVVAIDDPSIAALGRWPWSRELHARAIERIAAAGPSVIAYDVLFTEPATTPREDAALAAAMRRTRVALPLLIEAPGANGSDFDVIPPIEPERAAAAALGHVALVHEPDGSARGALLAVGLGGRRWPHLAEQTYRLAIGAPSPAFARALRHDDFRLLVPYAPSGAFRTVGFKDLVAGGLPPEFLRGRIVLAGATAGGLGDRHFVAGAGSLPGVEVQANLLNALLADRFVYLPPAGLRLTLTALPCIVLLLLFLRLRPSRALIASLTIFAVTAVVPMALLVFAGIWIPPASALLGLLIIYPLWGWRRLHAIHRAMSEELIRFASESGVPLRPAPAGLDPAGNSALALSTSIARLRDLKQLVSDTIEGVADPLVVTTTDGKILLANARALSLIGTALDRATIARLATMPSDEDLVLPDGRSFSPRATPLTGARGEQRGWILLLAEITAIRAAERDREEALEFLSHDMRSPQAAIVALLEGELGRAVPPGLSERLASHARRTLRLADDFVQLARLNGSAFAPEETDLGDSLAEACDAVWPAAERKGVRVTTSGTEAQYCVMGERHALTRALLNLLDNAVKFSPERAEVHCMIEQIGEPGRLHRLTIRDSGPGIAPERLSRLFGRFGPVANRGKNAPAGAGLGLSYARATAERHGGRLIYSPVETGGARFTLELPALEAPSASERDTG